MDSCASHDALCTCVYISTTHSYVISREAFLLARFSIRLLLAIAKAIKKLDYKHKKMICVDNYVVMAACSVVLPKNILT